MNNFEKFKSELTVERLADILANTSLCVVACDYCNYDRHTCKCEVACEYGIKKYLESEVE